MKMMPFYKTIFNSSILSHSQLWSFDDNRESLSIISTQLYLCKSGLHREGWIWKAAGSLCPTSVQKCAPIKCASQSVLLITSIMIVVNIVWEIRGGLGEKASWSISVILISFYHGGIIAVLGAFVSWPDSLTAG